MIQVTITNPNKHGSPFKSTFDSLQEAQDWVNRCSNKPSYPWGKPEHQHEIVDENGLSFDPPQYQTITSEFEVDIKDITSEVEQKRISEEALLYLNSTDFKVLRHIRQKALGQELSLSEEEYLVLEQERSEAAARVIK